MSVCVTLAAVIELSLKNKQRESCPSFTVGQVILFDIHTVDSTFYVVQNA